MEQEGRTMKKAAIIVSIVSIFAIIIAIIAKVVRKRGAEE